jgi:hypothetical protein
MWGTASRVETEGRVSDSLENRNKDTRDEHRESLQRIDQLTGKPFVFLLIFADRRGLGGTRGRSDPSIAL